MTENNINNCNALQRTNHNNVVVFDKSHQTFHVVFVPILQHGPPRLHRAERRAPLAALDDTARRPVGGGALHTCAVEKTLAACVALTRLPLEGG